jgi:hypothetical protein
MNQVQLQQLLKLLTDLLGKLSTSFSENITYTSNRYERPDGFWLYVGVEGDVQYEDMRGVGSTRHFVVGYHPTKIKAVISTGTTATDLGACFN